jgi:hypothetical protein
VNKTCIKKSRDTVPLNTVLVQAALRVRAVRCCAPPAPHLCANRGHQTGSATLHTQAQGKSLGKYLCQPNLKEWSHDKKKVCDFPVSSRYVTYHTLPAWE